MLCSTMSFTKKEASPELHAAHVASWKQQDMVRSGSVNAPFRTSCFNFECCLCVPVYPQVGSNKFGCFRLPVWRLHSAEICQVPIVYHLFLAISIISSAVSTTKASPPGVAIFVQTFWTVDQPPVAQNPAKNGIPRLVETRCRYTSNHPFIHLVAAKYHAFSVVQSPHGVPRRIPILSRCLCSRAWLPNGTSLRVMAQPWSCQKAGGWKSMILTYQMLDEKIVRTI
jgi:hypothetical protein